MEYKYYMFILQTSKQKTENLPSILRRKKSLLRFQVILLTSWNSLILLRLILIVKITKYKKQFIAHKFVHSKN